MGLAFKANFFLPMNATDFFQPFSEPLEFIGTQPIDKRSIADSDENGYDSEQNEKFERHLADAEVVESGTEGNSEYIDNSDVDSDFASTRWLLYKGLAEVAER